MQQSTSLTAVGTIQRVAGEVLQLAKHHLKPIQQARAGCRGLVKRRLSHQCITQPVNPGGASRPTACTAALTDMPAGIINLIISSLDKSSRIPFFRTCTLMRDAMLRHVAVDGRPQLRTSLHILADILPHSVEQQQEQQHSLATKHTSEAHSTATSAGLPAAAASRLLQLATPAGQFVHLRASATLSKNMTPQQMYWAMSSSNSRGNITQHLTSDWLSAVFKPLLLEPRHSPSLQCVTSIGLQDMALDHPMPECIGLTCHALKNYGLHNVVWPVDNLVNSRQMPWPVVQQLTLSDIYHPQLERYFNPTTLSHVDSLHLAWSHAFALKQWKFHPGSTSSCST